MAKREPRYHIRTIRHHALCACADHKDVYLPDNWPMFDFNKNTCRCCLRSYRVMLKSWGSEWSLHRAMLMPKKTLDCIIKVNALEFDLSLPSDTAPR